MGTYLSTPITSKHVESGSDLPLESSSNDGGTKTSLPVTWGVVDMQGWRKSMEDAHVARTDVRVGGGGDAHGGSKDAHGSNAANAKVFAVFDGHGGAEVARFCQMHLVDVLTRQEAWKSIRLTNDCSAGEDYALSNLVHHATDALGGEAAGETVNSTDTPHPESVLADQIAKALISSFHALDRLIDDPSKRDEIERWRSERPPVYVSGGVNETNDVDLQGHVVNSSGVDPNRQGETTDAAKEGKTQGNSPQVSNSTEPAEVKEGGESLLTKATTNLQDLHLIGDLVSRYDEYDSDESSEIFKQEDNASEGGEVELQSGDIDIADGKTQGGLEHNVDHDRGAENEESDGGETTDISSANTNDDPTTPPNDEQVDSSDIMDDNAGDGIIHDDSDDEKDNDDEADDGQVRGMVVTEAYSLISKLLHLNGNSSDDKEKEGDATNEQKPKEKEEVMIPTQEQLLNPPSGIVAPSAAVPTRIQNGRKVCNLPDHPVHAGCTSVVAVIVQNTLVVANAGDSRAVLCRAGGLAEPLSFDHKPLQKREMNRITKAGGFVNQFGRVNGNLNLSRSIGDLKYKQVPGIAPADQMITAEPDIISTTLRPGDEFIVLGCDGIWDCLSNEECVKYVRDRIETKSPCEIGMEMLDEIVSEDPRASQGIGESQAVERIQFGCKIQTLFYVLMSICFSRSYTHTHSHRRRGQYDNN
ncbi:hypothetical protein ACHAW6_010461, partial [Cyclotella cf. meneghiniana]